MLSRRRSASTHPGRARTRRATHPAFQVGRAPGARRMGAMLVACCAHGGEGHGGIGRDGRHGGAYLGGNRQRRREQGSSSSSISRRRQHTDFSDVVRDDFAVGGIGRVVLRKEEGEVVGQGHPTRTQRAQHCQVTALAALGLLKMAFSKLTKGARRRSVVPCALDQG